MREDGRIKHVKINMRFTLFATTAALALLSSPSASTDAFVPTGGRPRAFSSRTTVTTSGTATLIEVPTEPIQGMKPGTSGLRKKVEVWQGKEGDKHYVENFIQSLLDTATEKNGGEVPST